MRTYRARFLVFVLASPALSMTAGAQGASTGNRVRIMEANSRRPLVVGQLIRTTIDSVVMVPDGGSSQDERAFFLASNRRLERSVGYRRRILRGMGTGLLVGAVGGGALGAISYKKPDCTDTFICFDFGRGFAATAGALVLSVPGVVIGGIVGAQKSHEVWRPMTDRRVQVAIAPTAHRGVRLSARMSF